jgi:catechol 2,3-dioxygenase-like lactoylglutathione lyase family enzyme
MNMNNTALTKGCHHIGLTVTKLEDSAAFFTECLGWQEVRRDDSYPAIFVSDGSVMVSLWKSKLLNPAAFDKNHIGLHHVAFTVDSEETLNACYQKIKDFGVKIEFRPELLRDGPAKHMIFYEPSGNRVELIWPGQNN